MLNIKNILDHLLMNNRYIVADSGSTKTDWVVYESDQIVARRKTQGINPFMLDSDQIERIIREELCVDEHFVRTDSVYFYGAGCRGVQCDVVQKALRAVWSDLSEVLVQSDLVGAARALFPHEDGIVCILGTGSNSGLYLSGQIVENVSPLGYVLGDEGSGAVLGKKFLGDILKKQLPESIQEAFWKTYDITPDEIIRKVYKEPMGNRYLASFAPFLNKFRHVHEIHQFLVDEFTLFLKRNVMSYHRPDLPVGFVGSIAYFFADELAEAVRSQGLIIGPVKKEPLD